MAKKLTSLIGAGLIAVASLFPNYAVAGDCDCAQLEMDYQNQREEAGKSEERIEDYTSKINNLNEKIKEEPLFIREVIDMGSVGRKFEIDHPNEERLNLQVDRAEASMKRELKRAELINSYNNALGTYIRAQDCCCDVSGYDTK